MRDIFINCLNKNIESHKNLILMVGDLGYSVIESFQKNYPSNFFNAGVAEQNMTGMAAGIASEGFHVFTYSIGNFNTFRCAEQIRNDIDYHNLNVTIVSVGGGLGYGALGYSHHAIQDYALIRSFPNMLINSASVSKVKDFCKVLIQFFIFSISVSFSFNYLQRNLYFIYNRFISFSI